jgi:ArgJ family
MKDISPICLPHAMQTMLPQVEIGGKTIRVGGIAKGSGMIHPNMATMLGVVTCDADVEVELWRALFKRAAVKSFNQVLSHRSLNECRPQRCQVRAMAGGATCSSCTAFQLADCCAVSHIASACRCGAGANAPFCCRWLHGQCWFCTPCFYIQTPDGCSAGLPNNG